MDIFDQILANLELERDLGIRTVEIDRALLSPLGAGHEGKRASVSVPAAKSTPVPVSAAKVSPASGRRRETPPPRMPAEPAPGPHVHPEPQEPLCDMVFFTGRPLSSAGAEAMEKIFAAIRKIRPDIRIGMNAQPGGKICVVLGSDALRKLNPAARPVRGDWTTVNGMPAIMTFSPDYIFSHFSEGSPRMRDAKTAMWNDIKSAVSRLG